MIVSKIKYPTGANERNTEIFETSFIENNKNKQIYRIIYKNKLYPLQKLFEITANKSKEQKIKLISYNGFLNINKIIKEFDMYKNTFQEMSKMVYKFDVSEIKEIKIFGKKFVEKNKDKCFIMYKDKVFHLQETILKKDIEDEDKENKKFILFLIKIRAIKDKSYMFEDCENLEEFYLFKENQNEGKECSNYEEIDLDPDSTKKYNAFYHNYKEEKGNIENSKNSFHTSSLFDSLSSISSGIHESKWNIGLNISLMFHGCSSLVSLPDLWKWETNDVSDMIGTFCGCKSLESLPDISGWKTNNVKCMSGMFEDCYSLKYLPDISKWDTKEVIVMSQIFSGCTSLISLPDLSKWDTSNVCLMSRIFGGCSSLISLPDISKWNTNNVMDMQGMFQSCKLEYLPDISKWNTNNVINMSFMFAWCNSLIVLPDISKWNTNNVIDMQEMFEMCKSLISLPDISKWDTNNLVSMPYMFHRCSSLTSLPDISRWKNNNLKYMLNMFDGCSSLISFPDISKWNNNEIDMSFLFENCVSLVSLPDLAKYKNKIYKGFEGCFSLIYLPGE